MTQVSLDILEQAYYILGFRDKCCATFDSTLTLGEGTVDLLIVTILLFDFFGRVVIDAISKG